MMTEPNINKRLNAFVEKNCVHIGPGIFSDTLMGCNSLVCKTCAIAWMQQEVKSAKEMK